MSSSSRTADDKEADLRRHSRELLQFSKIKDGATVADIEKLHRIDPKQVKKEVENAGFGLEEESKVLSQKDDHSLNAFDPAIRGKTDQFAYRFVKPKK